MNITETKTKVLKVADLRPNEGQITGVPSNPRYITDYEFQALCKSLEEDNLTGVLQMKVYNWQGEWVVLDGNMRLRALQEMGIEEVQCLIVPEDADAKTLRKIVITSNSTFGQYDMDALANDWSDDPLSDWGVDVPKVPSEEDLQHMFEKQEGSGEKTEKIVVEVPSCFSDILEDIKGAVALTIEEWKGCKVK